MPALLAAIAGAAWFTWIGGWRAVAPTSFEWLATGDMAQHVLGWLFFRGSRWSLPLGRIDGYAWPSGTTVGLTDSNPLVAIPLKLASPVLPLDFQFAGPWLLACFALQGWAGARVAALGSRAAAYRLLAGALFALAPPLTQRVGHDTLCAHFALVLLLALHLAPPYDASSGARAWRAASLVTLLLGAVHPYLAVMALVLTVALAARLAGDGVLSRRGAAARSGALVAGLATVFGLLGYLTSAPSHGPDFGLYGADLLTFFDPQGASWLVPPMRLHPGAWEGNAYLGLGALALVAAAAFLAAARWRPSRRGLRSLAPVAIAALLLAAFSLADVVRAGGRDLMSLRVLYHPLAGLVAPFRTSGRFAWPLYYLVLAAAVVALPRLVRRPALAVALLAAAVVLQVVDLAPAAFASRFAEARWRLRDPRWRLARGGFEHLALVPAQIIGGGPPCWGRAWGRDVWPGLAYEAYASGLTVNSGYVARGSKVRFEPACREVERDVAAGRLDPRTVYVVDPPHAAQLAGRPGVACGTLDGYDVCAVDRAGDPLVAALRTRAAPPSAPAR